MGNLWTPITYLSARWGLRYVTDESEHLKDLTSFSEFWTLNIFRTFFALWNLPLLRIWPCRKISKESETSFMELSIDTNGNLWSQVTYQPFCSPIPQWKWQPHNCHSSPRPRNSPSRTQVSKHRRLLLKGSLGSTSLIVRDRLQYCELPVWWWNV